jgi:hypothetical protein
VPDVELVAPTHAAAAQLVRQRRRHHVDRFADRLFEELDREAFVGWPDLVRAVLGHGAVEADDRVQVHEPAALVLGNLRVRDAHLLAQPLLRHLG